MNTLAFIIPAELIKAIGWTLLHSLWQGATVMLLATFILWLVGKKAALLRYQVLCVSMVLIFLLSLGTFFWYYAASGNTVAEEAAVVLPSVQETAQFDRYAGSDGILASIRPLHLKVTSFMESNSDYLVLFWFLGFMFFLARYTGGLYYIRQLRKRSSLPQISQWQQSADRIAARMGIRKGLKVKESAIVNVPVTIGHLKPLIIFPLGMLGSIPPEQLEVIMMHEMAHIVRRDYLVNLMQSFMEAIFFYHPAVWWISQRIREERENICDDITVKQSNDPITYIKALTNMEELRSKSPVLANAITGKKKHLLNRVKRMMQPGATRFRPFEGLVTAVILGALVLLLGAGPNINPLKAGPAVAPVINTDAVFDITWAGNKAAEYTKPAANGILGSSSNVNNSEAEPDTTKNALSEEEQKRKQEEMEAARQEAKSKLKEAQLQQEMAMDAYREAMEAYKDAMQDIHMEQFEDQLKWVYKLDGDDSAVIVMKHISPNMRMFTDEDFDVDVDVDLDPHTFFKYDVDVPEHGKFEYNYNYSMPKRMEIHKDDGSEQIIIKNLEGDFLWTEDLEKELKQIQKDAQGMHREIEKKIIVRPDMRGHQGGLNEFYFLDREPSPERIIKQELVDDGLIVRGKGYIVELNTNSMYINGEKHSKDVFKKYKKIYEGVTEKTLEVPVKMVF